MSRPNFGKSLDRRYLLRILRKVYLNPSWSASSALDPGHRSSKGRSTRGFVDRSSDAMHIQSLLTHVKETGQDLPLSKMLRNVGIRSVTIREIEPLSELSEAQDAPHHASLHPRSPQGHRRP